MPIKVFNDIDKVVPRLRGRLLHRSLRPRLPLTSSTPGAILASRTWPPPTTTLAPPLPAERFYRTALFFLVLDSVVTLVSTGKLDPFTTVLAPAIILYKGFRWWRGYPAEMRQSTATRIVLAYLFVLPFDASVRVSQPGKRQLQPSSLCRTARFRPFPAAHHHRSALQRHHRSRRHLPRHAFLRRRSRLRRLHRGHLLPRLVLCLSRLRRCHLCWPRSPPRRCRRHHPAAPSRPVARTPILSRSNPRHSLGRLWRNYSSAPSCFSFFRASTPDFSPAPACKPP